MFKISEKRSLWCLLKLTKMNLIKDNSDLLELYLIYLSKPGASHV